MGEPLRPFAFPEVLHFRPKWWWDPVPDWLLTHLDKTLVRELAIAQIEFQKTVLDAQLKAVDRTLGVLSKMK